MIKFFIIATLIISILSQVPTNDTYTRYEQQKCCPLGYNSVGIYCVKCNEPKYWNPLTQKCVSC